jgi:hypothetical protein
VIAIPGRAVAAAGLILAAGCATLRQIAALRAVDFALGPVTGARVAGVDLGPVRSFADLTAGDLARIGSAVARRTLPIEFTLGLEATNPAENQVTARMVRLDWTLLLQDRETVHGTIDSAVTLPAGETRTIPMTMRLDLYRFVQGSARDLVELVLGLTGRSSTPTRVSLRALPTVDTPLGPITYPSPITIVSRTVGGDR